MLNEKQIIEISVILVASIILGWLIKKILFPYLIKMSRKTKWKSDDLIIESIGHWIIFWFFIGAVLYILPLITDAFSIGRRKSMLFENLIEASIIFSITWVAARVIAGMIQIRSKQDGSEIPSTSILGNIIKVIIFCIGFIIILQIFGIAIAPLVTALGVGGLAVALAMQPTLSNLFSGLQIIASGKINIGDFVQLENGQKGFVRDITWRNTTIETGQNNIVIVPNSKMADSIIENFFLINKEITFHVVVKVDFESNLEKVEKVSIETAKNILEKFEGAVKEFEPFVFFYHFAENGIELKIFLRVKEYADQFMITSEFIKALHTAFKAEKINIPFPVRTVYLKNQNG